MTVDPVKYADGTPRNEHQNELTRLYVADEAAVLDELQAMIRLDDTARAGIEQQAAAMVQELRRNDRKTPLIDQFLAEYSLSTDEGVILMRLAESLLRTPDRMTRNMLFRDRLGGGDWQAHGGHSEFGVVNLSTRGLSLSKRWIENSGGAEGNSLLGRLGDRVLGAAIGMAMVVMGEHFVLGRSIHDALKNAGHYRDAGFCFSFDMLGEAAVTAGDAEQYFTAYMTAIKTLATQKGRQDGLSVKLSALHPRYELAQADKCVPVLVDRLRRICLVARQADIGVSIDAEEAERLEISLQVIRQLLDDPALAGWHGLGVVVQAYQRRASAVIRWLAAQCRAHGRHMPVRLVKGAYWDSEIKRAQELGLESYPVFTRKENTDVSYLACATLLLDNRDVFFPQFATHNAHTAAAVIAMAGQAADYEFQCLHGMGEDLHRVVMGLSGVCSRIYAPVGQHADLLPYLVRRLLENGANSSFVNQLFDPAVDVADIVRDPVARVRGQAQAESDLLPAPRDHLAGERLAAAGLDLTQHSVLQMVRGWFPDRASDMVVDAGRVIRNPANDGDVVGVVPDSTVADVASAFLVTAVSTWHQIPASERARVLRNAAGRLADATPELLPLIVREAGKSLNDAVAEIREAVDFCLYYADQCTAPSFQGRQALGTVVCISPWNFPMAIFLGQVVASLAAGNTVIAKPAEQTPLIARRVVEILYDADLPGDALQLVFGGGEIGRALVAHTDTAGICFTGSTRTAQVIHQGLVSAGRSLTPLIAETGGINAMIVDSTALLEQAVGDIVASAFQSAGQRCSACRVVCVQADVADAFIDMLSGAMAELRLGDPADPRIDVGPVIDHDAVHMLRAYISASAAMFPVIAESPGAPAPGSDLFVSPVAFEIPSLDVLEHEVFGPVLHVFRYGAGTFDQVIDQVNALGYGLTMGLHTRIDARARDLAHRARVGNLYVNRNQIGAVVGVQPFGGEGLSGTGPKAGGPFYLQRLSRGRRAGGTETDFPLPGPTGERNRLRLHPRGHLVFLGEFDFGLVDRACALGNSVSRARDIPDLENRIAAGEFAGFILGSNGLAEYQQLNVGRAPGILPLLTADDPDWRFMVERTVSTDTTAAGGNASLLAGIAG